MRVFYGLVLLFFVACSGGTADVAKVKKEVMQVEQDFVTMVNSDGMKAGFMHFADDSVVLKRDGRLIRGKKELEVYLDAQNYDKVEMHWTPESMRVSADGSMVFSYGNYTFKAFTPQGDALESVGVFHTIWQKLPNGEWRYVFD
jgi:ketosteroid isomerase-like protein